MISSLRKDIVRAYVEAFNRGDIDAVCRCFAPDALIHGVLGGGDLAKVRPLWEQLVASFALSLTLESIIEEGPLVAVRYTERGQFIGAFRGIPPTSKPYEVVAMEWFEIPDSRITRRWGARDSASIFKQMELVVN